MELKAGYKQTEVGVIPDAWDVKRLDEVFKFLPTGNNTRSELTNAGDVKYIHYGDIHTILRLFLDCQSDAIPHIDSRKVNNLPPLEDGDVVMADASEDYTGIGAAVEVKNAKTSRVVAGLHTLLLRGDKKVLLDGFKTYIFSLKSVHDAMIRVATGVSVYGITKNNIKTIPIPIPPLPEQQAIAAALSHVDALIAALDALIAKKRNIKQGTMQELFTGKKRLAGFSGAWERKKLGEIAEIKDGTHQTPKYVESGVPFFSVESVTGGDFTNTKFISEKEHEFLTKSYKIEKGDILMTRIGSIGDCKLIDWDVDASFYVSLALLKIRAGYSAAFISHYSNTAFFKKEIDLHSLQSAIPRKINLGAISNVQIEIPLDLAEQRAIAEILSDMDAEIEGLERKRAKYQSFKQGMMQELLTGKTRLV